MDKKIKVVFLSFYSGEIYRGVETYVHELCNRLSDSNIDLTVYQNGPKLKNSKYKTVSIGLTVDWNKKDTRRKLFKVRFTDYYSRLIGKFTRISLKKISKDTDIIVTNNGSLQVLYVRIWSFLFGVKHIAVGQSGPGADDKWNLMCQPNIFITLTKFQSNWAKSFNPSVKVREIPNGVDLLKFNSKVKPIKVNLPHPIILSVGALEPGKRLDLLIKAVAKTKASLLLVGKGNLEIEFKQMGKELLKDRLEIISLPFEDMPKVYPACDLFSYPTVPWESFGIVMVEAMASGLPVVATDDPIRREIVGEAGLYVDPNNTIDYASTLEKALNTKWGDKPRKQAENFSWDDVATKYHNLFQELSK